MTDNPLKQIVNQLFARRKFLESELKTANEEREDIIHHELDLIKKEFERMNREIRLKAYKPSPGEALHNVHISREAM